jgi:hypothetical protein
MPTQSQFAPPRPRRNAATASLTVTVAVVDPAALPDVAAAAAGDPRVIEVIPVNGVEDLAAARGTVVALCEAGVLPAAGGLTRLVGALSDHPHLGMVGGPVVPAGPPATPTERLDDALRLLRHLVAREDPRLDGLVAVRARAITGDEASTIALEHAAGARGLGLRYLDGPPVATAVPPAGVRDLLARRRAAAASRRDARRRLGYVPATGRPAAMAAATVRLVADRPGLVGTLVLLSAVEAVATWWRWPASTPGSPRSTADPSTSSSRPGTPSPAS